jgi:hypothetical protein
MPTPRGRAFSATEIVSFYRRTYRSMLGQRFPLSVLFSPVGRNVTGGVIAYWWLLILPKVRSL